MMNYEQFFQDFVDLSNLFNTKCRIRREDKLTLCGWKVREVICPILCPINPSWYLMVLSESPHWLYTPIN